MQQKAYIKEPYERDVEGAIAEIEEMSKHPLTFEEAQRQAMALHARSSFRGEKHPYRKHSGQMPDIT
ncbi:MAG: hypothetical protein ACI3Y4_01145 [Candidatus Cryptobacteroides sp.]